MNLITILIIVAGVVLVSIIIFAVLMKLRSKKKENALKSKIDKIKAEAKSTVEAPPIVIVDDEEEVKKEEIKKEEKEPEKKVEPIIENLSADEIFDFPRPKREVKIRNLWDDDDDLPRRPSRRAATSRGEEEDDFEDFLNEHSYTRKVLDKDMINKLNSLPPEVRALLLSNIFNKFDN